MLKQPATHRVAVLQALLVTFLWSTSWVLIKIGLEDIPALTFAGLRYVFAATFLLPLLLRKETRSQIHEISTRQWGLLILFGLLFYSVVQGAQFIGLAYLPAATVSIILNFTSILVAFMGIVWLREIPGNVVWIGIFLSAVGGVIFFYPVNFYPSQYFAILIVIVGTLANAGSSVFGRHINYHEKIPPLLVSTISMGIGGLTLLCVGLIIQGVPQLSLFHWAIITWMAIINTAFAFTLWNHTLRTLPAMESSIINGTMLIQIALLAWIFLEESLSPQHWVGMIITGFGVLLVQIRQRPK
jgi:drug/metabolite transporter (DMT)-like permease